MDLQGILDKQSQTPQIEIIQKSTYTPEDELHGPLTEEIPKWETSIFSFQP